MTNEEKLEAAREALVQASCELEEAAKIIRGQHLDSVASIFDIAGKKALILAQKLSWQK